MANISLDLYPTIRELSNIDIESVLKNVKNQSEIIRDYRLLIQRLREIALKLKRGEKLGCEMFAVAELAKKLSYAVTSVGSLIPGPIGIVCSLALALFCLFKSDYAGFFLSLLGCIPFVKAGSKIFKALENLFQQALRSNKVGGGVKMKAVLLNNASRIDKNIGNSGIPNSVFEAGIPSGKTTKINSIFSSGISPGKGTGINSGSLLGKKAENITLANTEVVDHYYISRKQTAILNVYGKN